LLSVTPDSTPLSASELSRLEDSAWNAVNETEPGFLNTVDTLVIAYSGSYYAEAAAYIAYWPLLLLTGKRIAIGPLEDYLYYMAAYISGDHAVLAFIEPGSENNAARLLHVTRAMNIAALIIAPPLPPPVRDFIDEKLHSVIEAASSHLDMYYILASAKLALKVLQDGGAGASQRLRRIREEYGAITLVYEELLEQYRTELDTLRESIRGGGDVQLYYSTTLRPAARYTAFIARYRYGRRVFTQPLTQLLSELASVRGAVGSVIVYSTDVEEDIVKEVEFKLRFKANVNKYLNLRLHTDPLTAPLYASMIAHNM